MIRRRPSRRRNWSPFLSPTSPRKKKGVVSAFGLPSKSQWRMAGDSKSATLPKEAPSSKCVCPFPTRRLTMDKSRVRILIVDDERGLCAGIQEALQREGYSVDAATDASTALQLTESRLYNLVITDYRMPQLTGLELLAKVRGKSRDTLFILMTAYGTVEGAVDAMKQGAYDYLAKPLDMQRLRALVQQALEFQAVVAENNELRLRLQKRSEPSPLIGESDTMRAVERLIEEVANSDVTVLVEGESGT